MFDIFDLTTPLVEGLSIDEAFLDVRGMHLIAGTSTRHRHDAAPASARKGRPAHHRRRRADQVPGQGRQRRRQARWAAGRADRRRAGVPAPPPGRVPVGRRTVTAKKLRAHGITRVGEVARLERGGAGRAARAGRRAPPARAGPQPRPAPGRAPADAAARSAPSARSGARLDARRRRSTPSCVGLDRPRRPPHARGAAAWAARSSCACASTIFRAPPARTRCRLATAHTPTLLAAARACWSRRCRSSASGG